VRRQVDGRGDRAALAVDGQGDRPQALLEFLIDERVTLSCDLTDDLA
jgi:hypothetical protein